MNVDTKELDFVRCPKCEAVNIDTHSDIVCRRCNQKIFNDIAIAKTRTIAYLVTGMIFFVIANVYPMLIIDKFGSEETGTIISGVIDLWIAGSYVISAIILIASVFIPLIKFILIIYLIISVDNGDVKNKHTIFHITEMIGPWSMIDVFVVAILTSLVHLANIKIIAGMAASAFALMVLFTLLAALSFDTRLIKHSGSR
ncbi:MAG: paraquat-inducible protein A [Campylobacterales bacterium]|nr:paraquat-inducible protein A [Campylobacterales bacterium]